MLYEKVFNAKSYLEEEDINEDSFSILTEDAPDFREHYDDDGTLYLYSSQLFQRMKEYLAAKIGQSVNNA